MNRAWTARPTPTLDQFGEDLTDLARANLIGFMVGHEEPYRAMVNILSRESKNNALLVGAEGAGKDTIIGHLAFRITRDEVPPKLFDKRLVKLSIASLTANIKTPGELQARLEKIVNEIILAGNVVLYLPDVHSLEKTAPEGGMTAFDTLKPLFRASVISTVATSDSQNYRRIIEQDQDFRTLFEKIEVGELTPEESLTLLTYESYLLEAKERITISYPAIKRAVDLAYRYLRQKPLPASAVDLLQEAIMETKNRGGKVLEEITVAEIVSRKTRIPVIRPKTEEAKLLMRLEDKIHERLVNQEEAVRQVASAMRQYRAGISREKGPIAAFLFAGPTGVGKTELAKTLAALYFGGEEELVRFDMSEYKDPKSVWNFIGSPDGAVAGNLIEAVKHRPFAVLLLDEFEKAHKDVLELFLPILDEGYIVSSLGDKVDMKNMIIIATSNAHSVFIKEETEKGTPFEEISDLLKKRLTEYFKPEMLNRFDGIIAFRPLKFEEISKIAQLQLEALARRLAKDQGITIQIGADVAQYVARLGWDPVFGARPLRGVISEKIREMLAKKILLGELKRSSKAELVLQNNEIMLIVK
jgi:ATP-dependent Clp protease ATP-binding subunit ClpC